MTEEFNLSDKIKHTPFKEDLDEIDYYCSVKDVKEFIRKLKEKLRDQLHSDEPDDNLYISIHKLKGVIRKLAGDKLI